MPECGNCGAHVTERYVAVFEPDGFDTARCCPYCPDLVRRGNGVETARAKRGDHATGAEERDKYGRFIPDGED